MDKEQETLDMVLDIPNTISLNPFDRPPNIMDDDLNSVTQEELEANLSTDCPTTGATEIIETNTHQNANDMWEQLIQSVLEDTSTQDAVQQHEDSEIKVEILENAERRIISEHVAETEIVEDKIKAEVVLKNNIKIDIDQNSMDWDKDEDFINIDIKTDSVPSIEQNHNDITDKLESSYIKDERVIMDYSLEEEKILSQNVTDNYYVDGLNNDDAEDDICQIEVYASNQEDIKDESHIKDVISENEDEFLEDNSSDVSAISLGSLVKIDNEHEDNCKPQNDKVSHLSTIISDHCYSQEVNLKLRESDVLKQNVIHHLMAQNPNKEDHKKITKLVDGILNDLNNEKLNKILDSLYLNETIAIPTNPEVHNKHRNELENLIECLDKTTGCLQNIDDRGEIQLNEILSKDPFKSDNLLDENQPEAIESSSKIIGENQQGNPPNEQNEEIKLENLFNSHTNIKKPEGTKNIFNEEEISLKPSSNEGDSIYQKTLITEQESMDTKSIIDSLVDNCSETIEHNLFEEEFEELCKKGMLPIAKVKTKTDLSLDLLEKLKDFVSHLQKDCTAFTKASTNIDEKLHNYIKQQYNQYQDLFKPYCYSSNKQTVETQTDFKKLTKRKCRTPNKDSRNNLLNNSGHSKTYSSTSDEEDAILIKSPNKDLTINNSLTDQQEDRLDESKTLPSETKSLSLPPCSTNPFKTNYSQEYDDGINLSQYVQSEIFDIDSTSQHSLIPSDDSDSLKDDDDIAVDGSHQNSSFEEDKDEESDDNILFKIRPKKNKNIDSSAESKKTRKNQGGTDNMSVNSESDKENLTSDRKDKKSNDSLDEDEKNDKEIERLTNISGLAKRSVCNANSTKSSDKNKPKVAASKTLNDRFDFMDVEFGSDEEVKSDAEEEVITEKQFLERCNEDIKRQMLDDSSTDSDAIDEDDDELLKASSEEDGEGGNKSPLVEKFLKTYVVDDSDNDIDDDNDDDEDAELDSDKDEEASASNKEVKTTDDVVALDDKDKTVDLLENGEDTPSAAELELLDANFRYRNRSTKNQKLEKMLSDVEKRKNISKIDAELISLSSDTENSDIETIDVEPSQSTKPRALKPMLRNDQLAGETIKAQKNENERISRLEKKHNLLQKVLKEHPDLDKNKELILDYIKETKTFIKVHPGIVKHLKPHQFDGVRFMYDSCYGGVDSLKKSPGSGCILAHCMGLGKTLQLIALLHTVISYKELKTTKILVLCPKSTVMNWADEIIRWLGPLRQKNVKVYTFSDTSDINEKLSILREWSLSSNTRAGCLLIGYEAFRTLVFYHSYKNRGNINSQRLEEIRKNIDSYLLQPGADLVVCDEGHIIKNSKSAISMAVAKIVTPRRIVLTGTPIQNNLKEYYSMVNFIKPLFLGTEKEFANLYANPIKNGQHKDSGKTDIKIMKQRSFVLHKKLSKFVQRKEAELLKTFLPTKFEYVLFVPMTDVQNNLYQYILNAIANRDENYRGKGLITDYTCLRKIWTHPKVLEDAWKNAINQRNKREHRNKLLSHNSDDDEPDDIYDSQTGQMSVTNDWWRHLVNEKDLESVMPSNKLRTMLKILQMCEESGEKCLIFSAFVAVLNVVEYFFKKINEADPTLLSELNINNNSKWILGQDYYRLDGKTQKTIRHAMINEFNNIRNKRARVFLISAKAGGQGINLIGANRVIILDTSWNPSNDQQNIFRVFRLGQTRCCYIYRLLAMGTMEEKVYSRSVTKQAMSFRVVDEQQIDRHYNMAELAELYALTIPDHSNRPTPIRPQDNILARLLRSFPDLVFKYHEHDSLLENKVEQELSEQEKNEAWTAYERDLQMSSEIREMPNMEDLHNKFNANLPNYMSPFSGLDVSNSNNQIPNSSKNMSPLFNYRGFGQPFLQTLLGQNNNATTQQYIEMFNYYKNLGSSYADLNAYSQLPGISGGGGGRMPTASTASSVPTNPLTALGDLSMYGLSSSALQSLGASAAALNMPSSLSGSSAALQQLTNSASMYTSSPSAMQSNLPTTSASSLATGGLTSASNSAATLSAFEQYTQSLRGSFPNMYNYTGDFGLSSSGSTILDKSKGKNSKQGSSNNKNTNLPGGSKGGSAMGLYPGPPAYLPQQQQQQQQHQPIPNSRNTPSTAEQSHKGKSLTTSSTTSSSSSSNNSMLSANAGRSTNSNDLINYRRSDLSGVGSNSSNMTQQKKNDADNSNNPKHNFTQNPKSMKSAANVSTPPLLLANHKVNQKSSLNLSSNAASGSSKTSLQTEARSLNMGILYPNSKGIDKSSNKPNSPLNMGIVYPKSSNKSSSEMQIIPTSSPPGTTSISKQLNDLPPSISLTAVKNNPPNNQQQQNITSKTNAQNMQINKVIQSNNTTVRRTSPVQPSTASGAKVAANLNSTNGNGNSTASQNSILARYKTLNNNKKAAPNNNNPIPPLHRSSTIASIPTSNTTPKTPAGLTITNVKTSMKPQNITTAKQIAAAQQATTLAKQTAAAAVAKSNVQRLSTPNTPNSSTNPLQKPSAGQTQTTTPLPSLTSIKRVIKRASPINNTNKLPPPLSSSSSSLTVTPSTKVPIISSVKSISQSPSTMATITKASISKTNPSNNSMVITKSTSSASGQNLPTVSNVSKALAQMQKNLPASTSSSTSASNIVNATRSTVNIRPVDNKQNPAGSGGVYIIETNINDKKLAIGTPTKSGGGTTVTKVPIQNALKRKATDPVSKDISVESKRLKK